MNLYPYVEGNYPIWVKFCKNKCAHHFAEPLPYFLIKNVGGAGIAVFFL
jgi:hypothetical protein